MNGLRRIVVVALFTALVIPIGFASESVGSHTAKAPYKIGDTVKPFQLKCAAGMDHDLAELLGKKTVVLDFWNYQCPISQGFEDQRKSLVEKYGKKDVVYWAIDSNSINSSDAIMAYAKKQKLNYMVLKDTDNKVADLFGAAVTPEVFVIGKDKKIHYHGAISNNKDTSKADKQYLIAALDALAAGKEVKDKEIKAFGCGIKRAK